MRKFHHRGRNSHPIGANVEHPISNIKSMVNAIEGLRNERESKKGEG